LNARCGVIDDVGGSPAVTAIAKVMQEALADARNLPRVCEFVARFRQGHGIHVGIREWIVRPGRQTHDMYRRKVLHATRVEQIHLVSSGMGRLGEFQEIPVCRLKGKLRPALHTFEPRRNPSRIVGDAIRPYFAMLDDVQPLLASVNSESRE
jgi:hypothetical protein